DLDGVDAEVLYWPAGMLMIHPLRDKDPEAYRAVIRMYNDFLAEYCAVAPDRLIGNLVVPWTTVDDAIDEITYARDKGLRSVLLQNWPNGRGGPTEEDDRFWAAAMDLGMAISPHVSFGDATPTAHEIQVPPESALGGLGSMGNPRITTVLAQLLY